MVNIRPPVPIATASPDAHGASALCVCVNWEGTRVATGGSDKRVLLWSILELELTLLLALPPPEQAQGVVNCVVFCGVVRVLPWHKCYSFAIP